MNRYNFQENHQTVPQMFKNLYHALSKPCNLKIPNVFSVEKTIQNTI
jgi:hypothetical protein